jgi:hypothetical protein
VTVFATGDSRREAELRARARERFNATRMARDYERIYAEAIAVHRAGRAGQVRPALSSGVALARAVAR